MKENELNYDSAMAELQGILDEIQTGTIGLEDMQSLTARAMELIRFCRQRLRQIGSNLDQILAEAPSEGDQ